MASGSFSWPSFSFRPLHALHSPGFEEDTVRRLAIGAAVAELAERDQDLIALRFGADLTAAQIARLPNAKTNAVEVALHRALARLRSILESEEAGDEATAPPPLRSGAPRNSPKAPGR